MPSGVNANEDESLLNASVHQETRAVYFTHFGDDKNEKEEQNMSTLDESIKQLLSIEGATGAAVVDYSSGMALAQGGNPGFDLGVAAAGNSNVVSAKLRTMADLHVMRISSISLSTWRSAMVRSFALTTLGPLEPGQRNPRKLRGYAPRGPDRPRRHQRRQPPRRRSRGPSPAPAR